MCPSAFLNRLEAYWPVFECPTPTHWAEVQSQLFWPMVGGVYLVDNLLLEQSCFYFHPGQADVVRTFESDVPYKYLKGSLRIKQIDKVLVG